MEYIVETGKKAVDITKAQFNDLSDDRSSFKAMIKTLDNGLSAFVAKLNIDDNYIRWAIWTKLSNF